MANVEMEKLDKLFEQINPIAMECCQKLNTIEDENAFSAVICMLFDDYARTHKDFDPIRASFVIAQTIAEVFPMLSVVRVFKDASKDNDGKEIMEGWC